MPEFSSRFAALAARAEKDVTLSDVCEAISIELGEHLERQVIARGIFRNDEEAQRYEAAAFFDPETEAEQLHSLGLAPPEAKALSSDPRIGLLRENDQHLTSIETATTLQELDRALIVYEQFLKRQKIPLGRELVFRVARRITECAGINREVVDRMKATLREYGIDPETPEYAEFARYFDEQLGSQGIEKHESGEVVPLRPPKGRK